jgi:hypothetical protein
VWRHDDRGQPLDAADLNAMITAWRLAQARLAPNPGPFAIEADVLASRERVTRLLVALADVAAGQLLAVAALDLGEDSTEEEQLRYARDLADQAIADQTMAAHAVELGDEPGAPGET